MSGILSLQSIEVFYNEFVIVTVLLVCIVGDEIVNIVLICGFFFGVKESKLILPFIVAGMVLECPLAKVCMIGVGDVKSSFFYMR